MMFLEFAIQGAWLPLLFGFLATTAASTTSPSATSSPSAPIGAMLSPLIAGQIADRYMNAERVMALCHFIAARIVYRIAYATNPNELYVHSFLYGLFLTPTLALVNAISFRHLPDRGRDFGKVRVWGTAGWVVAGITIGHWLLFKAGSDSALQYKYMADAMRLAAVLGVALGFYCFTLPRHAPRQRPPEFAPAEALKEIFRQPLLILFLLAFPVAALHAFFFARAAEYLTAGRLELPADSWINKIFGVGGAGLMTVGQMSELIVLSLMPLIINRFSRKVLFAVGLTAYAPALLRSSPTSPTPAIIPALALHGIVFGCFFFLVFITIDEYTTKDVRSIAQNVFNLIIFGFGVIIGNWFSGMARPWETAPNGQLDWQASMPAGVITVACLIVLLILYPNRAVPREPEPQGAFEPIVK